MVSTVQSNSPTRAGAQRADIPAALWRGRSLLRPRDRSLRPEWYLRKTVQIALAVVGVATFVLALVELRRLSGSIGIASVASIAGVTGAIALGCGGLLSATTSRVARGVGLGALAAAAAFGIAIL